MCLVSWPTMVAPEAAGCPTSRHADSPPRRGLPSLPGSAIFAGPCGHSSAGRASASQAGCRGFEPRCPLQTMLRPLRLDFALRAHQLRGFAPAARASFPLGDFARRDRGSASLRDATSPTPAISQAQSENTSRAKCLASVIKAALAAARGRGRAPRQLRPLPMETSLWP